MIILVVLQLSKKLWNCILEKKAINICQAILMHTLIFLFFYFSQLCGITKALVYFSAPDFATFAKIY